MVLHSLHHYIIFGAKIIINSLIYNNKCFKNLNKKTLKQKNIEIYLFAVCIMLLLYICQIKKIK
jgi:predicted nucleic acid-binding Zn ribbon protein